jgi:hypothetical protein
MMRNIASRVAGAGSNQNLRSFSTILFAFIGFPLHHAVAEDGLGHWLLLAVKKSSIT